MDGEAVEAADLEVKLTSPTPLSASLNEHVVVAVELKLNPESGLVLVLSVMAVLDINFFKLGADAIPPPPGESPVPAGSILGSSFVGLC